MKESIRKIGAGGFWKTIDEKPDASVIKQLTPFSCVSAVGEMMLRERGVSMTQQEIIDIIGESSTTENLAGLLNKVDKPTGGERWYGTIVDISDLPKILKKGSFAAVLREGSPLGHLVFVEGLEENDLLIIKDPWDGTSYRMNRAEFYRVWNGELVFKWKF